MGLNRGLFPIFHHFVSKINEKELDVTQLLFSIKRCNAVVQRLIDRFSQDDDVQNRTNDGTIEPFALEVTQLLADQLGFLAVRFWVANLDYTFHLTASAGLFSNFQASENSVYLAADSQLSAVGLSGPGSFGLEKTGSGDGFGPTDAIISHCAKDEVWMADFEWVKANRIEGFVGFPLVVRGEALGILELFSRRAIAPELLAVLPMLQLSLTPVVASTLKPRLRRGKLRTSSLSAREKEVIELLALGNRDREISAKLYISERTVKFHVKNILKKMAVNTRVQAVFEATQRGWL